MVSLHERKFRSAQNQPRKHGEHLLRLEEELAHRRKVSILISYLIGVNEQQAVVVEVVVRDDHETVRQPTDIAGPAAPGRRHFLIHSSVRVDNVHQLPAGEDRRWLGRSYQLSFHLVVFPFLLWHRGDLLHALESHVGNQRVYGDRSLVKGAFLVVVLQELWRV